MGPTWGPPGSCRPQMGPMMAPWSLLSGYSPCHDMYWEPLWSADVPQPSHDGDTLDHWPSTYCHVHCGSDASCHYACMQQTLVPGALGWAQGQGEGHREGWRICSRVVTLVGLCRHGDESEMWRDDGGRGRWSDHAGLTYRGRWLCALEIEGENINSFTPGRFELHFTLIDGWGISGLWNYRQICHCALLMITHHWFR